MSYTLSPRRLRIGLLVLTAGLPLLAWTLMSTATDIDTDVGGIFLLILCPGAAYVPVLLTSLRPATTPPPRMFWRAVLFVPCLMAASLLTVLAAMHSKMTPAMAGAFGAGMLLILLAACFGIRARKTWMWMVPVAAGALPPLAFRTLGIGIPMLALLGAFPWWWLVSESLLFITARQAEPTARPNTHRPAC